MTGSPSSTATVRPARAEDVSRILKLITPYVSAGRLLPRTTREVRDLVATGFVADVGGEIVGFAALEIYSPKLAEIRSLAVSDEHRGRGLGTTLVQACVEVARKKKVLEVMVVTSSDEFFRGCGFDYTLPGEKKALFIQPDTSPGPSPS